MALLQIYNYTKPELDKFRELCNFTEDEMSYFNLKAKKCPNYLIAEEMNVSDSQVAKLSRNCRVKMLRIV